MSPQTSYLEALWPAPVIMAGAALRPFALGHALLLHRLASPFADSQLPDSQPGLGDLLLAIEICRRPVAEAVEFVSGGGCRRVLDQRRRAWGRMAAEERLLARLEFLAYLADARQIPRYLSRQKRARDCGTPWLAQLQTFLLADLHRSEAGALDTPLRLAAWWYCARLEREGAIRLMHEGEITAEEAAEQFRAELAAGHPPGQPDQPQRRERGAQQHHAHEGQHLA